MVVYLDLEDLIAVGRAFLGNEPAVRDFGLLESAVSRPKTTVYGEEAYPNIHEKAAALLHSLVANHALIDGNKRLGWVGVRLFYALNDYTLKMDHDEAYDLVISIASGKLDDIRTISHKLALSATPPDYVQWDLVKISAEINADPVSREVLDRLAEY